MKLALIFLWSIFLIAMLSEREVGFWGVETDWYGCYAPQADALIENGTIPIDDFRGPLYQVTLAGVSAVVGDTWNAGQLINFLFSLLCIVALWKICEALELGENAEAVATIALMLTPSFIRASVECGTDVFFLAIALFAVWAVIKDKAVTFGILFSLAILTRSTGFALIGPALFLSSWRWFPIATLSFLAWGLYSGFHNLNYLNTAALTVTSARLEELWYSDYMRPSGWGDLLNLATLTSVWNNAQTVIAGLLTELWFFPLSVMGLYGLAKTDEPLFVWMLFSIPLLCLIAFDTRYALTIAPCYAIGLGALCDTQ